MNGKSILAGTRRFAWAGIALWLVVVAVSAVIYTQTPTEYIATQDVTVTGVPIGPLTSAQAAQLNEQSSDEARMLTAPGFLTSQKFITVVVQRYIALAAAQGQQAADITPQQAGAALSASHLGERVTISAHASTTRAADLLAQAATETLVADADSLLPPIANASIQLIAATTPPHLVRDSAQDDAARATLLTRLGLATATAALLVVVLGWLAGLTPSSATQTSVQTARSDKA